MSGSPGTVMVNSSLYKNRYAKAYMCLVRASCLHVLLFFVAYSCYLFRSIPIIADVLELKWKLHILGII